jgi:hypothetical protein
VRDECGRLLGRSALPMSCADFVTIVEGKALRAAPGELRLGLLGMPGRVFSAMSWRSRFVLSRIRFGFGSYAPIGVSHRKLVRTGIPEFMAARALAMTGGSFHAALTFVHDNVDQPAEFWQPESERQESRPPSVGSQLLCSSLQRAVNGDGGISVSQPVPFSSEGLGTANIATGHTAEAARADALDFEELKVGDCVLINAAACDEAITARIQEDKFDLTQLPSTIQVPRFWLDERLEYFKESDPEPPPQPHRPPYFRTPKTGYGGAPELRAQWQLTLGTIEVECTVLSGHRWSTLCGLI